ncbi:MAG: flavin reductase family protein [Alphaproteobacteria bacterium]|nr:flavin reductase family protein [Alphaproteobacteria bacterium]MCB9929921.1 flavin reductase family protein [Alphaproteobacteria bacterium]
MTDQPAIDSRAYRDTLGRMPTGVTIITTCNEAGERAGATVGSFTSLSLDPPLVQFSLDKTAICHPQFVESSHFAINVLAEDQTDLSGVFASKKDRPWDELSLIAGEKSAAPLLAGCVAYIECAHEATYPGGDHDIFVGRVLSLRIEGLDRRPLLFFGGAYHRLDTDVIA